MSMWHWIELKKVTALCAIRAFLLLSWGNWGIAVLHKQHSERGEFWE